MRNQTGNAADSSVVLRESSGNPGKPIMLSESASTIRDTVQLIDNLEVGGAQRLLQTLAEHLGPDAGMEVISLDSGDTAFKRALDEAGAKVSQLKGIRLWNPLSLLRVARAIRASNARTVHLHLTYATIIAPPLARLLGRRVIVSLHNSDTVKVGDLRSRVLYLLEQFCLRHFTDRVIFVGDNVARANRDRIGLTPGVTIRNVIAPAIDITPNRRSEIRSVLGAEPSDIVVIATGRLTEQKDPAMLLRAFQHASAQAPRLLLWVLGDGELRGELGAIASASGLADRIVFLGERPDVARFLAAADIFALSSAWEGLPVGLLEAMAAGLSVVSTDVGDIGNVLGHQEACLVQPGSVEEFAAALVLLATDAPLRQEMSQKARAAALQFMDVQAWCDNLGAVYADVR